MRIDVELRRGAIPPGAAIDQAAAERVLRSAIDSSLEGFAVREARPGETAFQIQASVELNEAQRALPNDAGVVPSDEVLRGARTDLRLFSVGVEPSTGRRSEHRAECLLAKNTRVFDGFEGLMRESMLECLERIHLERALSRGSVEDMLARLSDPDPSIRALAVDVVRERRPPEAFDKLIAILDNDEEEAEVVFKTIGALIALGDPRAVGHLIDSARRRPPMYMAQIIFGVAQIGGKEAEAYLFTVASGHPDPVVKQSAKDALEELERRRRPEETKEIEP